jgi:hypothetical protein
VNALEPLKDSAGKLRDRLDHPQLRDVRRLLRSHADVVMLGESVLVWVGPDDRDRRTLPMMVRDGLRPDASLVSVSGGGYHAELLAAYLEVLAGLPRRPRAVVLPLWVRGRLRPWVEHPRFGHHDALARLRRLDPTTPAWRVRGSLRRGGDWAAYHAVPYETLLGPGTVGDYVLPLKGHRVSGDERLRLLYAYHHGGLVEPAAFAALGTAARALDVPVVAYQAPVPVGTGERVLPGLTERVARNLALADAAFRSALDVPVLQTGTSFGDDEFIDPTDASEHLNEKGRRRLAELLVAEVRARL